MNTLDVGPFLEQITEPLNGRALILLAWYICISVVGKRLYGWGWAGMKRAISLMGASDISDPLTLRILSEIDHATLGKDGKSLDTLGGLHITTTTLGLNSLGVTCAGERIDEHIPRVHLRKVYNSAAAKLKSAMTDRKMAKRDEWAALLAPKKAV